eukprot:5106029-Pyramimonas_sp.AAC.1
MYIELRVRRLRVIQASVKYPTDYDQWLTALFGSTMFEIGYNREHIGELGDSGHLIAGANPMAKHHYNDVLSILELDSAEEFSCAWDGSTSQLYYDAEVAAVFSTWQSSEPGQQQ